MSTSKISLLATNAAQSLGNKKIQPKQEQYTGLLGTNETNKNEGKPTNEGYQGFLGTSNPETSESKTSEGTYEGLLGFNPEKRSETKVQGEKRQASIKKDEGFIETKYDTPETKMGTSKLFTQSFDNEYSKTKITIKL